MSSAVYLIRRPGAPAVTTGSFRETRFRPLYASRYPSIAAQFGQRASGGHSGVRVVKEAARMRDSEPCVILHSLQAGAQSGTSQLLRCYRNLYFLLPH